jgi:putative transposase
VKYGQIEALRQHYPASALCRLLGASESGDHAWRKRPPSARARQEARLETEIRAAHQRTRETRNGSRPTFWIMAFGWVFTTSSGSAKKLGLRCRQKRKFKATTDWKTRLAGGAERAGSAICRRRAEQGLAHGYHVHRDG